MNTKELQSLDEALDYLNEGKFLNTIKNKLFKKKKDDKKQYDKYENKKETDVYIIESESRKKFISSILSKCKSIANKYNFGSIGIDYEYFEDFYICVCRDINPRFDYYNDLDYIIFGSYLDRIPNGMTEEDFCRSELMDKWNKDIEDAKNDCIKAFSKYGNIDDDGDKDEFFIYITINKETIKMLEDEDDKIMNKKAKSIANDVFKYYKDQLYEDAADKYGIKESDLFVELYNDQCNREFINFSVSIKNCDGWYDFKVNPYMWELFVNGEKKSSYDGVDYNFND